MRVVVMGPNLNAGAGGSLHVHAADCRDARRLYGRGSRFGGEATDADFPFEADTLNDVAVEMYPPGDFTYDPNDPEEIAPYVGELRVFDCCSELG